VKKISREKIPKKKRVKREGSRNSAIQKRMWGKKTKDGVRRKAWNDQGKGGTVGGGGVTKKKEISENRTWEKGGNEGKKKKSLRESGTEKERVGTTTKKEKVLERDRIGSLK